MPAFNFQSQFAYDVERGIKHQTIRAKRKYRPRPGQTAYCFTGMRTSACRRLGQWPIVAVRDIWIQNEGVLVSGGALPTDSLDEFARLDGFRWWTMMLMFFKVNQGLPFNGDIILWDVEKSDAV